MSDNDFVKGVFLKTPHENAPDFIKRKVNIKVDEFIEYLQKHKNDSGYVNFDMKEAKSGHWYLQIDDWQPNSNQSGNNSSSGSTWGNQDKKQESFKPPSNGFKPNPVEEFEGDIPF